MNWQSLLQKDNETIILPWVGGKTLQSKNRKWKIEGNLPTEHNWYSFNLNGRKAIVNKLAEPDLSIIDNITNGYLIGDRLIPDSVSPNINNLVTDFKKVHLIEMGLNRFARVSVGQIYEKGPFIFNTLEFSLGPEDNVSSAFLDKKESVDDISEVSPALESAFKIESWRRDEAERRRLEEEKRRLEEEEKLKKEENFKKLQGELGTGYLRREIAQYDFKTAAESALSVGGAIYLDHRKAYDKNEMIVIFRLDGNRYECVCNKNTLRITDAGICLTDEVSGEKGDDRFSLESLPSVIREAKRNDVLVVFRHVN